MKYILGILIILAAVLMFMYWYAGYSSRSGFAIDENQNNVPDSWEAKMGWFFKARNFILLFLGILIGYTLSFVLQKI